MRRIVEVHLAGRDAAIGTLFHDHQGARESSAFEYARDWLADRARFAIDPSLPLVAGPQFHGRDSNGSVFAGAFADTEPDGWGKKVILRDHAKRRADSRRAGETLDPRPLDALDFLLHVDDVSRVGALRLHVDGTFRRASEEGRRTTPPLVELAHLLSASRAVETNTETAADLAYLRGRGTSLGGLRPKCTVVDDDGSLAIGKFPSVQDDRSVTKGEVLALTLAARAGIRASAARLVSADGTDVALIRRFDRQGEARVPYVSAATLMGVDPRAAEEYSYTDIVDAIRRHGNEVQRDLDELWRRLVFSILITNVDDHLMNHGFLYAGDGTWSLSPAFDVNPFPDRTRELKTWISADAGPAASLEGAFSVIKYFRIAEPSARSIVSAVNDAVASWRSVGASLGMSSAELDAFEPAFEHDERARAAELSR